MFNSVFFWYYACAVCWVQKADEVERILIGTGKTLEKQSGATCSKC
jgi:hypothetical protein